MTITICVTSDLHGRMDRLEFIHKHIKQIQPDILIDNGDFLQGSLSTYYFDYIAQKTNPMLHLANTIGYDVAIFGNHEFNYPLTSVNKMRNSCEFPWIAGNIGDFAKPYIIKTVRDKRIAIVGVTTHFTPLWDEQNYTKSLTFTNALDSAKYWVQYVYKHEHTDYIVLSYHGGFTSDPNSHTPFAKPNGENQANEMLQIPHLDALITGHQHLQIATVSDGIPVVQPGANGNCIGLVTLGDSPEAKLIQMEPREEYFLEEVTAWLFQKIGYSDCDLTYHGLLNSRIHKPAFVDFLHDVQLNETGADISLVELMFHEQGGFKDHITNYDVLKNISRPNTLKVLLLSGRDIKAAMEQCAAVFAINQHGEIDFSYNVHTNEPQPYLYDYFGGLDYTIDVNKPVGSRVQQITFKGHPLKLSDTYKVVMNSYRATGVDFPAYKNKQCVYETTDILPAIILKHVKYASVTAKSYGIITVTKGLAL